MSERDIPKKYREMYERSKTSRKAAMRFFCIECMGYDSKEIKGCTDTGCSLWKWRNST